MGLCAALIEKVNILLIHILTVFKENVDPIQSNGLSNNEVTFSRYKSWECNVHRGLHEG